MKKRNKNIVFGIAVVAICCLAVVGFRLYETTFHMPRTIASNTGGYLHFSVDDSNSIFEDLTVNADQYDSAFDQPLLKFVKNLHDKYGIAISFYVYYSWDVANERFALSNATDQFRDEFAENADWLRFGFHAKDANAYTCISAEEELEYYNRTVQELIRITGSEDCIDNFVRLDRYQADSDMIQYLHSADSGLVGLLGADDSNRQSYALTDVEMDQMYTEDWCEDFSGMYYTPTDIRLEKIDSNDVFYQYLSVVSQQDRIIIFTHEWVLNDENVRKYMRWFAEYAYQAGKPFGFPEDNIGLR